MGISAIVSDTLFISDIPARNLSSNFFCVWILLYLQLIRKHMHLGKICSNYIYEDLFDSPYHFQDQNEKW